MEQKTVAITIRAAKLSGRLLAKAIAATLRKMKQAKNAPIQGKQTVRQLAGQNAGMTSIEITDGNIKSFERVARKYGVDFALKKDNGPPPRWMVFFKARDTDALTAAFTEFSRDTLKRTKKTSVRETMRKFKELVKKAVIDRPKQRERGGPEL